LHVNQLWEGECPPGYAASASRMVVRYVVMDDDVGFGPTRVAAGAFGRMEDDCMTTEQPRTRLRLTSKGEWVVEERAANWQWVIASGTHTTWLSAERTRAKHPEAVAHPKRERIALLSA
jgi:hypothetical protein